MHINITYILWTNELLNIENYNSFFVNAEDFELNINWSRYIIIWYFITKIFVIFQFYIYTSII